MEGWALQESGVSEQLTHEAMRLSQRLQNEVDLPTADHIRWLHRWCGAASLKGHCLSRLPGVAVTSIAVAIGCRLSDTSRSLLQQFHDGMACAAPYFNFDELLYENSTVKECCVVPLTVIVNHNNCASRMTVGTTRHLVDTIAFALALDPDRRMQKDVYAEWRRRTMVRCAQPSPFDRFVSVSHFARRGKFLLGSPLHRYPVF